MIPMKRVDGAPARSDARPGMAFFAGSGPMGERCGTCKHRGYSRESSNGTWNEERKELIYRSYRVQSCAAFKRMTGGHGPPVNAEWPACKYFEPKPAR